MSPFSELCSSASLYSIYMLLVLGHVTEANVDRWYVPMSVRRSTPLHLLAALCSSLVRPQPIAFVFRPLAMLVALVRRAGRDELLTRTDGSTYRDLMATDAASREFFERMVAEELDPARRTAIAPAPVHKACGCTTATRPPSHDLRPVAD